MRKYIVITILACYGYCNSQSIYFSDEANQIFQLDLTSCTTELIAQLTLEDTLHDIAIDLHGSLYGISNQGNLYDIDIESGTSALIHSFLFLQSFHALIAGADGLIYTTGSEGFLYSYDVESDKDQFLGDIGFNTVGDLIFHLGNFYATTSEQEIIRINIQIPSASKMVMMTGETSIINGLFAFDVSGALSCEPPSIYGMTDNGAILAVNLEKEELTNLCNLSLSISGATSTFDQSDFLPLSIIDLKTQETQCKTDNGSVTVQAVGGLGLKEYSIDGVVYQADSILHHLGAGDYRVQVRDINNCVVEKEVTIEETSAPAITEILTSHPKCNTAKGSLIIDAQGHGNLGFSIDSINFQQANYFSELEPGSFLVTVVDSNGCIVTSESSLISQDLFRISNLSIKSASCKASNGELALQLREEIGDISFTLDGIMQTDLIIRNLTAGDHILHISDDEGCAIDTVVHIDNAACSVFIPTAFTPDHDGVNDDFRIHTNGNAAIQIKSYHVFDKWGNLIYDARDFSIHDNHIWWDGSRDGQFLNSGIFVYAIELLHDDGVRELLKGHISIVHY